MSGRKIAARDIIERFNSLKHAAKRNAESPGYLSTELDLHDAAMSYAAAVNRVAKKDRAR